MPEIDFLPYIIAFVKGLILGAAIYLEERAITGIINEFKEGSRNKDKDDQDKDDQDKDDQDKDDQDKDDQDKDDQDDDSCET